MSKRGGWIRIWRRMETSPVFRDAGVLQLWMFLLLRAHHRDSKQLLKIGKTSFVVELKAGQYAMRTRLFAQDLGIARNTLDGRLAILKQLDMIAVEADPQRRFTLVTILNWDKYQPERPPVAGSNIELPSEPPSEPHQEKVKKDKKASCAEQNSAPPASEFEFPTKGKNGRSWTLPQGKLDEYRDAYPDLDVSAEMRQARQWCRDNSTRRKTAGAGMLRFLTRWLNRAQNSNRSGNGHATQEPAPTKSIDELRGSYAP